MFDDSQVRDYLRAVHQLQRTRGAVYVGRGEAWGGAFAEADNCRAERMADWCRVLGLLVHLRDGTVSLLPQGRAFIGER